MLILSASLKDDAHLLGRPSFQNSLAVASTLEELGYQADTRNVGLVRNLAKRKYYAQALLQYNVLDTKQTAINILQHNYDLDFAKIVKVYVNTLVQDFYNKNNSYYVNTPELNKNLYSYVDLNCASMQSIVKQICKTGLGLDITQYKVKHATTSAHSVNNVYCSLLVSSIVLVNINNKKQTLTINA